MVEEGLLQYRLRKHRCGEIAIATQLDKYILRAFDTYDSCS